MAEVKIPDSLPWVHEFIEDESSLIYTREGGFTEPHDDIYIVHAANAYPALVEALKAMVALYDTDEGCKSLPEYVAARAALKAAGVET